ncbi:hypothetical protein JTE90_014402 [Oedothorax gibbosus]|uniref:Uncharacterized protein n=1 Tax=Oedothorax gibbosus TaxID=931172 RepID=A0AAV6V4D6_9ARAC|nr:hypothetical protein JTE90_014402 [Oedothorax gibbosus]
MFAHQIFSDFKENADKTSFQNVKSNGNEKIKGLSLKNSTNIAADKRVIKSAPSFDIQSPSTLKKNIKKENSVPTKEEAIKSSNVENWPETENMYIYNEPEDDYEDILPKSERITRAEMEALFDFPYIGRYIDHTNDKLPVPEFEEFEGFEESFCMHRITEEDFLCEVPEHDVPLPDDSFDENI